MNLEIKQTILEKIREYDRILLFRHFRPDGDAVGSTKGLQAIIKATWPEKEVYHVNEDYSGYLEFMGPENDPVPEDFFSNALGIVIDTATLERTSSQKHSLCRELIKIDHHIDVSPYGDYSWVEEHRSSACELIVDFYNTFSDELVMTKEAATYLYTGMVTDSGRFRFRSVTGETMRLAGILLDYGIDTETLYAHLYLEEFSQLKFKAHVYDAMKRTENGVAYLFVDKAMQEQFGLSLEDASASVTCMDSIKGCLCWIAFIETGDEKGTIRVRLRSRFAAINHIAEQFRGGGHACASGATVYSEEELMQLVNAADAWIKEYKETNEGWL
ncbi:MAG: bifunctional oligoribonuclease/PAP phosphatase NrnA [Lachnospiraceae bacterium]|nr:bifunctional oligoribonuclease/PAP phosphatase NrnA [Lachnospiraceae bacterium]